MIMPIHPAKVCLVVIYNHNFERNIQLIRRLYKDRFSSVIQIMPFHTGKDPDVIRVFGNSFQFHGYIAQARHVLSEIDCGRYLFVGDDLILNPHIHEGNIASMMKLEPEDCFYPGFHDVSKGDCLRGTMEAHNFAFPPAGIDASALASIPTREHAFQILHGKGLMESMTLSRVTPYLLNFHTPVIKNLLKNYRVLRARAWHYRNSLRYRLHPRTASYPTVFGYSDIFSLPKSKLGEFYDMIEVFASIQMFVELAIPTSLALHQWNIVNEADLNLKTLNVWFPQDPKLFSSKSAIISKLENDTELKIENLTRDFPDDYLYMHPVKLSRWE
jgi:hypothetical protein